MKCVVALAMALTAQAIDIDWKIPVAQQSVTVDPSNDGASTITFKWNGFHNVYEMPSEAAMNSCDFTDAQEIAPSSSGGSVTVDAPADGETKYYACEVGSHCNAGQRVAITSEGASDEPTQNIVEIALSMTDTFSTLVGLLQAADLVDTLSGPGPFTVFAPTNDAFAKIDAATLESLAKPENKDQLTAILTRVRRVEDSNSYHVLSGEVLSSDLSVGLEAETLQGSTIEVTSLTPPTINDNSVIGPADVLATNGVIHVIDTVLMPTSTGPSDDSTTPPVDPTPPATDDSTTPPAPATDSIVDIAAADPDLSTLVAALTAADLLDAFDGKESTVFAPTNDAFDALPAGTVDNLLKPENKADLQRVLLQHVVQPGKVMAADITDGVVETLSCVQPTTAGPPPMIGDANVVQADIMASDGVVHKIDAVLLPAADLYETIDQHGDLDKFQKMLKRANLEDNLEKKPWTVFAPNDRAVDKANDNPLKAALLALDENGVTKYHLSDIAAWSSAELSVFEDNFSVKTFQGDEFLIDKKDGELEIKDGVGETADFKEVDILTCQGYLHVIDKVLFYDDADGSDGALGKAVGLAAGAVALGAALL